MNRWRATASLARALGVGAVGGGIALLLGRPVVLVLVAPFVVLAALGLMTKPAGNAAVWTRLAHGTLQEGQGTLSELSLSGADDVEWVTRVSALAEYVALSPTDGVYGYFADDPVPLKVSPRRWGRRRIGEEKIGLFSPWAGYRWGPFGLPGLEAYVLPAKTPYDSVAEAPQPLGLIGRNRSRRVGSGTEFSGIRPYQPGDRLKRINWRVSLRTDALHVVTTRAEEDTALLLVVDALADYGVSGGVGREESSLDVGMRAAAAIAEQHVRGGDRVALRVIGYAAEHVRYGAGERHLRRILGTLARVRPGVPPDVVLDRLEFGATAGTVVVVLSPMLSEALATATVRLVSSGLPVMVVDTLPPDAQPSVARSTDPVVADIAWRMRRAEREHVLDRLAAVGCPVVAWAGPRTLDDVMRRLARRAQAPRVRVR
ncbi:MAG: DUF58 domain-containing protein [Nocardioides sp.]